MSGTRREIRRGVPHGERLRPDAAVPCGQDTYVLRVCNQSATALRLDVSHLRLSLRSEQDERTAHPRVLAAIRRHHLKLHVPQSAELEQLLQLLPMHLRPSKGPLQYRLLDDSRHHGRRPVSQDLLPVHPRGHSLLDDVLVQQWRAHLVQRTGPSLGLQQARDAAGMS